MKLSYNWLKSYLDFDLDTDQLGDLLTALGLEVEGTDDYESIKGSLVDVITGEVITCDQHPNADRLSVTTVDVGAEDLLQIVCGAPNVKEGQKVVVAQVGTNLYDEDGKAWLVKKSKIRGELSEGMICAEDELGLGNGHDGILTLDPSTPVGVLASEIFDVVSDTIYDIGLTPNRSDATAHIGAALDIAAGLGFQLGTKLHVQFPAIQAISETVASNFHVEIEDSIACPRYSGMILDHVRVGESPKWIQQRLDSIGVRSINNVVDITNFVLHEMGQPLHAFDLQKIQGNAIHVKCLPEGSKFTTLDDVERSLLKDDLMICDGNLNPLCIAGVFGGTHTGVTDNTTSIFLESAHFNADSVRRTSMSHILRTDAAKIFEKGSDSNMTTTALWRAANLLEQCGGAKIRGPLIDIYPNPVNKTSIQVRRSRVNELLGLNLSAADLLSIFDHLNFEIAAEEDDVMTVLIPTSKSDVVREVDVIEEVLRIYGYDHVEVTSKLKSSLVYGQKISAHLVRSQLIDRLNARGFHQMMNLSLSKSAYYGDDRTDLVHVINTSNSHLNIMRPDMFYSAVETASHNVKHQNYDFTLFEFGNTYETIDGGEYQESEKIAFVLTGKQSPEHWDIKTTDANFYLAKSTFSICLPDAVVSNLTFKSAEMEHALYGQTVRSAGQIIGHLFQVKPELCLRFDINQPLYYAELNFDFCLKTWQNHDTKVQEMSKYPGMQRDLAIIVDKSIDYQEVDRVILDCKLKKLTSHQLFDIYENKDQLGPNKKSFGLRFEFLDSEKTLKDKEVDKMINKLMASLKHKVRAELR